MFNKTNFLLASGCIIIVSIITSIFIVSSYPELVRSNNLSQEKCIEDFRNKNNDASFYDTDLKHCSLENVEADGSIQIILADSIDHKTDLTQYYLTRGTDSKRLLFVGNKLNANFNNGDEVKVKGLGLKDTLIVDARNVANIVLANAVIKKPITLPVATIIPTSKPTITVPIATTTPAPTKTISPTPLPIKPTDETNPVNTLAVIANFTDTNETSITPEIANDMVFNYAKNYYLSNSYGKYTIAGDVLPTPVVVNISSTCNQITFFNNIISTIDPQVDFRKYTRVIIYAPIDYHACGFSGVANDGLVKYTTNEGIQNLSLAWIGTKDSKNVTIHEYGHTFGLKHANFYNCGNVSFSETGCVENEYGDPYDVMGKNTPYQMNAKHLKDAGWLTDGTDIQNISTSGVYTIKPLEINQNGIKALSFHADSISNTALYIEYRQKIGLDSNIPLGNGALLHYGTDSTRYLSTTKLLDATPPSNNSSPLIEVGQTFSEYYTGTKITVLSADANTLTVSIQMGKTDFDKPTVSYISPANNTIVTGTIHVRLSASDPTSGIKKVEIYKYLFEGTPIATLSSNPYEFDLDTTKLQNGGMYFVAVAYDDSGSQYGGVDNRSSLASLYLIVQNIDTIPPQVSITSPSDNDVVNNPVTINVNATDNNGIYYVELWKDQDTKAFKTTFSYPFSITNTFDIGKHTVYVKAYDYLYNVAVSQVINIDVEPFIKILTPNTGDDLQVGGRIPISYNINDFTRYSKLNYYLIDENNIATSVGYDYVDYYSGVKRIDAYINISEFLPLKKYKLLVSADQSVNGQIISDQTLGYLNVTNHLGEKYISISSPKNGDVYDPYGKVKVNFTLSNLDHSVNVNFTIYKYENGAYIPVGGSPTAIFPGNGTYTYDMYSDWGKIGNQYKIEITILDYSLYTNGTYPFKLSDGFYTQDYSLRVVTPNGGEVYNPGKLVQIKLESGFITRSNANAKVTLLKVNDDGSVIEVSTIKDNLALIGNANVDWLVPNISGKYKIRVITNQVGGKVYTDDSDAFFTVTDAAIPTIQISNVTDSQNIHGSYEVKVTISDITLVSKVNLVISTDDGPNATLGTMNLISTTVYPDRTEGQYSLIVNFATYPRGFTQISANAIVKAGYTWKNNLTVLIASKNINII